MADDIKMGGEDGTIRKQEEDYTADVDVALPIATALASVNALIIYNFARFLLRLTRYFLFFALGW